MLLEWIPLGVTGTVSGGVPSAPKNDVSLSSHVSKESILKSSNKSRPIVCHSCGEPGHTRPNFPNKKVKRVMSSSILSASSRKYNKALFQEASIVFLDTPLLVDSGCEISCVSSSLAPPPPTCYTGMSVLLQSFQVLTKSILFLSQSLS